MIYSSRLRRLFCAAWVSLVILLAGTAEAAVPAPQDVAKLLLQADRIKTSRHAEFAKLLQRLDHDVSKLSSAQQWHLRYLKAWEAAYVGDYQTATSLSTEVMDHSGDITLRFRAGATAVNILGIGHRYEEAFARLSQLLDQLPQLTDKAARFQVEAEAAQLYTEAGQFELASRYANQMDKEIPTAEGVCKAAYFKLDARYRSGKLQMIGQQFQDGIDICIKAGETLFANGIRSDVASLDIQQGRPADAIDLLQRNYADVQRDQYRNLISKFDALLAQAYWTEGVVAQAKQFALAAVDASIKGEYTQPLSVAYKVLYQVERQQGNFQAALAWHEKYMAADKAYLDDVGAKMLTFQVVKQQVQANKQQVDALNKQNQILQLQQALDRKAVETSRLYIVLLLLVLVFIGLWIYRLKRSQLRFMSLARRDGLTGIFNRQHFVDEAERALGYVRKSDHGACLVLIDLDHFKLINDTHGHAVGDLVLKRAVAECQKHLRSSDVFGRLGGEEFAILLPECSMEHVMARAEQIRLAIAAVPADHVTREIVVSASFGVASAERSGYDLRQLLADADDALYRAKRDGRNCVVSARTEDPVPSCQ